MRVIAGSAKGHRLAAPKDTKVRPTADRVKEAVFSMLSPALQDCLFLDLFSGTGAMGIEALSRGAKKAVFVDSARTSVAYIKKNLAHTGLTDKAQIYTDNVSGALHKLFGENFDIIFMDPPYGKQLAAPALQCIWENKVLDRAGMVVVEYARRDLIIELPYYEITKIKDYHFTKIVVYQYANGNQESNR